MLQVYVGYYSNLVGHLTYDSDNGDDNALKLGLIFGGCIVLTVLLAFAPAFVITCIARLCVNKDRQKNDRSKSHNPDVVHMGSLP